MGPFLSTGIHRLLLLLVSYAVGQTLVRLPPTITKHPLKDAIFRHNDSVTLECQAVGTPNITYSWKKNGVDLNDQLSNISRLTDGTLTIQSATYLDEGHYQCSARNEYGTAVSTTSHIQKAVLDSIAEANNVLVRTARTGEPFYIQAITGKSYPKPNYRWELVWGTVDKTPSAFSPSSRVQIADNGDLHFANAKPDDEFSGKMYKSVMYNHYLDVKAEGGYTRVTVTDAAGDINNFAPVLGFASEEKKVGSIDGSVNFRCFFYGMPEPSIEWRGPEANLSRQRTKLDKFNTELNIVNIEDRDEGIYTCTASNSEGQSFRSFQLLIETEPSFKTTNDRPRNFNVSEGDSVTFNCKADAKPTADIVWLRNGEKINAVPTRYMISRDKKSLTIVDICLYCKDRATDIAVIQCNASNRHGYAFASGYLNVFERTEVIARGDSVVTVDPDNSTGEVVLDCSVKHDPTAPVKWTWYKREPHDNTGKHERLEERREKSISINKGSLKIKIDLTKSPIVESWRKLFGSYICVADNGISRSNATIELKQFVGNIASAPAIVNGDDRNVFWPWTNIVITMAATLIGSIIIFFLFNRCYYRNSRGKSNLKAEIEDEKCTEEPGYETIPYDDLPIAQRPSLAIESAYITTTDIRGGLSLGNRILGIDCAEEMKNIHPATTVSWDDQEGDDDVKEMNEYSSFVDRKDSYLALYSDLNKDIIEESV